MALRPIPSGRVVASVVVHALAAAAAFFGVGAVHVLSGRGIWGVFPSAYQVRQLSVYLMDALPFFIAALLALCAVHQWRFRHEPLAFRTFLTLGVAAAALAALLHAPFFPTSARAGLLLAVMALLYVSAYPVIDRVLFGWSWSRQRFRPFPFVPAAMPALAAGMAVGAVYMGFFLVATSTGYIVEEETYRVQREPSDPRTWFKASARQEGRPPAYSLGAPDTRLFRMEELPVRGAGPSFAESDGARDFGGRSPRFADLDGDGFTDMVVKNAQGSLGLWLNRNGVFEWKKDFLDGVGNRGIHDFYFADYDRDGKLDVIVSKFVFPRELAFESTFLKKSFWYSSEKPAGHARLYRQRDLDNWQDVTEKAFPEGAPWAFRKVEPIFWFDANGDGLLDFVWSQYPHPRRSLNRLYVQEKDGTFKDRIEDFLDGGSARLYAEGSDVADVDGDGDIDLFAYGFLYRNEGGTYRQVCGKEMPGIFCDASGRNDEGGLFEDVNADGVLDLVLSHHGTGAVIPKYYMQLFLGDAEEPRTLKRVKKFERQYYGFHGYLRAADFDFNGYPDILTSTAGRMLTYFRDDWVDLLPTVTASPSGAFTPLGWIDLDEDGDWDFIARRESDLKLFLFRNQYDPKRYVKISALGGGGVENQFGATIRVSLPGGRTVVHAYRQMGGYAGTMDPRLIFLLETGRTYEINACFPSMGEKPKTPPVPDGVTFAVTSVDGNCISYTLAVSSGISRVDLDLIAGAEGARVTTAALK